jgi:hypothetical protein
MPILQLTNEQVLDLVKQLSPDQQEEIFKTLLVQQWGEWEALSRYGTERVRRVAAQRGYDWDAMTEDEREAFIDTLVHEDRQCAG